MDQFGISTAMRSMVEVYFTTARRTGRTTQMLDSLKDGDRIVCIDLREAQRLQNLLAERELKVKVLTCHPDNPRDLFSVGTPEGRTVFDHSWVEQYFRNTLARAEADIDKLQTELSGYGEAHRVTARKAAAAWYGFEPRDFR
jgi:hypothetical protein